jgi:hypothetical protein
MGQAPRVDRAVGTGPAPRAKKAHLALPDVASRHRDAGDPQDSDKDHDTPRTLWPHIVKGKVLHVGRDGHQDNHCGRRDAVEGRHKGLPLEAHHDAVPPQAVGAEAGGQPLNVSHQTRLLWLLRWPHHAPGNELHHHPVEGTWVAPQHLEYFRVEKAATAKPHG